MANVLWMWIANHTKRTDGRSGLRLDLIDDFEQRRKSRTPITEAVNREGLAALRSSRWDSQRDVIPFVDYLVNKVAPMWQGDLALEALEELLKRNGSAWKVGTREGHPGLERRVPLGVQEAAEHTMVTAGDAGKRLSEAWHAAFGVNPDPSKAYGLAVKAVEDAAVPQVCPTDSMATLGKVISTLRSHGDWSLPFAREDQHVSNADTLIGMLKSLWAGQADRHGGNPDPTLVITQEAAEAAVMLAVPLVQWFTLGTAARP